MPERLDKWRHDPATLERRIEILCFSVFVIGFIGGLLVDLWTNWLGG